jgi:LacI family transcriptional regulator
MKPSIRHVAERANVSHATVSRVLNKVDVRIAPETRLRVERIASEMGYRPNRNARALATGRTQTVALWATNLRSAYYGDFIHYIHEEALRHDYDLIVSGAKVNDPAASGEDVTLDASKLVSWPVDGILAIDPPRGAIVGLKNGLIAGVPFVNVGGYVLENADYVRVDFRDQTAEAIKHLAAVGCRRIAYLVPDWFEWFRDTGDPRLCGYESAMAELGLKPEFIVVSDAHRERVAPVLPTYLQRYGCPDGLFCYNDDLAIGAFAIIRSLGLRIPEDVALIGCDGIREASYLSPPLTTLVQPLAEMCSSAWSLLKRRIQDPLRPLQQVVLKSRLEIRGSSNR